MVYVLRLLINIIITFHFRNNFSAMKWGQINKPMEMKFWKGLLTVLEWWDFIIKHAAGKLRSCQCQGIYFTFLWSDVTAAACWGWLFDYHLVEWCMKNLCQACSVNQHHDQSQHQHDQECPPRPPPPHGSWVQSSKWGEVKLVYIKLIGLFCWKQRKDFCVLPICGMFTNPCNSFLQLLFPERLKSCCLEFWIKPSKYKQPVPACFPPPTVAEIFYLSVNWNISSQLKMKYCLQVEDSWTLSPSINIDTSQLTGDNVCSKQET